MTDTRILSGNEKAALIMMTLGIDDAAAVTRHTDNLNIRELALAACGLNDLTENDIKDVLEEFQSRINDREWKKNDENNSSLNTTRDFIQEDQYASLDIPERPKKKRLHDLKNEVKHFVRENPKTTARLIEQWIYEG